MKKTISIILLSLLVGTMLIGAMSCTNKIAKAKDVLDNSPIDAAKYCAEKFPVKETFIAGKDSIVYDTLWGLEVKSDTIVEKRDSIVYKTIIKTLPAKVITKTVLRIDTIIKENTAKADYLLLSVAEKEKQLAVLQSQFEDMKSSRNKFRLWFWVLVGAVGAFTLLKLKRIL